MILSNNLVRFNPLSLRRLSPTDRVFCLYSAGWETLTDTTWVVVLVPDDSKASTVVISSKHLTSSNRDSSNSLANAAFS
jgi:hypothetical protein